MAMTLANATAQTASGCLRMDPVWGEVEVGTNQLYSQGMYVSPFREMLPEHTAGTL